MADVVADMARYMANLSTLTLVVEINHFFVEKIYEQIKF